MALYMRRCAFSLRQVLRSKTVHVALFENFNDVKFQAQRTIISDTYKGTKAWRTRKILAVNMDELKIKLDADFFDNKELVASVALHKFVDNISSEQEVEGAKKYLFCHRHSPVANHLRASTVHCFLRACIDIGMTNQVLDVLQDKTSYGLFPDNFTFNLLLDDALQRDDIKMAATVAMEMMTMEVLDSGEPLSQLLALLACHRYFGGQTTEEEKHNLGMTFADATRGQNGLLSSSYHILGLSMAGRYKQAGSLLQAAVDDKEGHGPFLVQEVVDRVQNILESEEERNLINVKESLSKLEASGRISPESLDNLITSHTLPMIKDLEMNDANVESYPLRLETWHEEHVAAVKRQILSAREHEVRLKEKQLDKLMESVGGLKYWRRKQKQRQLEKEEEVKEQTGEDAKELEQHKS